MITHRCVVRSEDEAEAAVEMMLQWKRDESSEVSVESSEDAAEEMSETSEPPVFLRTKVHS